MSYSSKPLPLEFWTRMEVRLAADYQVQLQTLADAMKPTPVTVDTGEIALQRAEQARASVFTLLADMENMQLLLMILGGQVRGVTFRAEIPRVEAHIACLRNMAELYSTTLVGLPRRAPLEQEVQAALAQYAALRTAGTGEVTMQERQRLRAMTIEMPIVGAEDTVEHVRSLRALHASIDRQEAELQQLKGSTLMSLNVPDHLAFLVSTFGVDMLLDAEPASPASLPAPELAAPDVVDA
jgi:hypothetical protein